MPLSYLNSLTAILEEYSMLTPVHKSVTLAAEVALLGSIWFSYKALSGLSKQAFPKNSARFKQKNPSNSSIPNAFLKIHVLRKREIIQFSALARNMIHSSKGIITQEYFVPADAYATLPLIKQLREKGERLSSNRKHLTLGSVQSLQSEIDLRMVISELRLLEQQIKRIPRSKIALSDVLEGRFNDEYLPQDAARSEMI